MGIPQMEVQLRIRTNDAFTTQVDNNSIVANGILRKGHETVLLQAAQTQ